MTSIRSNEGPFRLFLVSKKPDLIIERIGIHDVPPGRIEKCEHVPRQVEVLERFVLLGFVVR